MKEVLKTDRQSVGSILALAIVPVVVLVLLIVQWMDRSQKNEPQINLWSERQNTVLTEDARTMGQLITAIFERLIQDVKSLSLIEENQTKFELFYQNHVVENSSARNSSFFHRREKRALYRELIRLDLTGREKLRIVDGKVVALREHGQCLLKNLCDRGLLDYALEKASFKKVRVGSLIRFYTPQASLNSMQGTVYAAYNDGASITMLGLDYRVLWGLQYFPIFPYEVKNDLLQSYEQGNYIYMVDQEKNVMIHPKSWHVMGIDEKSGSFVEPMKDDSDEGSHPLSIAHYKQGRLRSYFDRLLLQSFNSKDVDLFRAPNLSGTNRVLAVVPMELESEENPSILGWVIVGCSVDYFEEPKENKIPYL